LGKKLKLWVGFQYVEPVHFMGKVVSQELLYRTLAAASKHNQKQLTVSVFAVAAIKRLDALLMITKRAFGIQTMTHTD
jgi:hypothetical protein